MSAVDRLLKNYARQVQLPWAEHVAGMQRVWFAVYPPAEERRVRARLPQCEAHTLEARHGWTSVDLSSVLPEFLAGHKYRESIFKAPQHFRPGNELEDRAVALVTATCGRSEADAACVVAVTGLATMFDFMRVSSLIGRVEDSVRGRLLVFFPGSFENGTYRLLDARDGWNYLAVPITLHAPGGNS